MLGRRSGVPTPVNDLSSVVPITSLGCRGTLDPTDLLASSMDPASLTRTRPKQKRDPYRDRQRTWKLVEERLAVEKDSANPSDRIVLGNDAGRPRTSAVMAHS